MVRGQVLVAKVLVLSLVLGSCETRQESPAPEQGHITASRRSELAGVHTWFVWSYFGVDQVEEPVPGLGANFSTRGWVGVWVEDVSVYALYVEAQPGGELTVCQDYEACGLQTGDSVEPAHLLRLVKSKGGLVENADDVEAEAGVLLGASWHAISEKEPDPWGERDWWTTVDVRNYPVQIKLAMTVIYDDWRGHPPVGPL